MKGKISLFIILSLFVIPGVIFAQPNANYQIFWQCSGATDSSQFGHSTIGIPDQNGDSYGELLVASLYPNGVFLYYGGEPMDTIPDMVFTGTPQMSDFGGSLQYCPNLTSLDYGSILINAYYPNDTESIYLYECGPCFDNQPDLVINSEMIPASFGLHTCTGDVNGDGFYDFITTDTGYEVFDNNYGKLYVYFGGLDMDNQPDFTISSQYNNFGMQFGQCVACGDVNGDEYDDILITASLMNYPYYSGIAYLFYGGAEMDTIPDWSYTEDEMIPVCSIAPKLNGDNFADVLLYTYSSTLVFFGSESLSNTPNQIFNAKGGYIGDLNNDGYDDLLGTGHIIWGSDSGLSTVTYFNVGFPIWGSVGSSSDFNGDSFLEFGYYSINPQQIGGYRGTIYLYADSILSGINRKPVLSLSDFSLQQNYPNPFNNSTIISFNLNITENVEIYIYNILGQKVVELMNEQTVAGFHQISWNAEGLSSGVYLIRLETPEGFSQSRKAIIVK